jgi:hypothetical protein
LEYCAKNLVVGFTAEDGLAFGVVDTDANDTDSANDDLLRAHYRQFPLVLLITRDKDGNYRVSSNEYKPKVTR